MKKDIENIKDQETVSSADTVVSGSDAPKKSKVKHFWNYVTDYKRTTVALTVPSITFDFLYSGFCFTMSILFQSFWLFIMSIYYSLLCLLRVNILYRAGRGVITKNKRFSERINYRKFSRNLILLDIILAFVVYYIVQHNVKHDYFGKLIYVFGGYVCYKVLIALINIFKAHKSRSLTALSLRKICIVDAMVSSLSLEWALSHRNEWLLSDAARTVEQFSGYVIVVIIFLMGFAGLITCIRLKAKEKKEGNT